MKKLLALSILSVFLLVLVGCEGEVTLVAPSNFTLTAGTNEVDVVLAWTAVTEDIDGYIIYFNSAAVGTVTVTSYTHADPQETGTYYVTAYSGDTESDPSTSESTVPVIDSNVEIAEIGVSGQESGYGWNTTSGQGTEYSMADGTHAGSIDLYFTDFVPGYAGTYNIASPHLVLDPGETGASWLASTSGWRTSGFYELTDNFDDITVLPLTGYYNFEEIAGNNTYAVYTDDGHYAIVEVQSWSTSTGLVQIRTAFQTVPGLAILEH
jgi:hypothetical protein